LGRRDARPQSASANKSNGDGRDRQAPEGLRAWTQGATIFETTIAPPFNSPVTLTILPAFLSKVGEVLIRDGNDLRAVVGGEHVFVAVLDALLCALDHVDFPAMITTACRVADHALPGLLLGDDAAAADHQDPRATATVNTCERIASSQLPT
jgi:hypothetical protein